MLKETVLQSETMNRQVLFHPWMQAGEECQDSVFSDESCPVEYRAAHRNTAGISVPFYRRRHGLSKVSCFAKSLASICSFRNYTLSTYYLLGLHLWCSDEQNGNGSFPQGGQYLRRKTDTLQHTHTSIYLSVCLSTCHLSVYPCIAMISHWYLQFQSNTTGFI